MEAARIILALTAITRGLAGDEAGPDLAGFLPGEDHAAAIAHAVAEAGEWRAVTWRGAVLREGIGVWKARSGNLRTTSRDPGDAELFLTWESVLAVIGRGCRDGNLERYAAASGTARAAAAELIIRHGCEAEWLQPGPGGLPDAAELTAAVRQLIGEARAAGRRDPLRAAARLLDRFRPAVDEPADTRRAADWLGIQPASVYREKDRVNADGSPRWAEPDGKHGNSEVWTYRAIVLARAQMPRKGRPRKDS